MPAPRRLGNSPLVVPPVCLGTMYFGTRVAADDAHHLLDVALDEGLTFLDTANNYAFWEPGGTGDESEGVLRDWFARRGPSVRDRVVLATKVGARPQPGGGPTAAFQGLSAASVRAQLDGSLARLGLDHVDLLYAHIDDATPVGETLSALDEAVQAGKVRAIGWSNTTPQRLAEATAASRAHGWAAYSALQMRMSYLSPAPDADFSPHVHLTPQMHRTAADLDVTVVGYSALAGGGYSHPERLPAGYRHPGTQRQLDALGEVAAGRGATAEQVVLAWMASLDPPVIPLPGASSVDQVRLAAGAARLDLRSIRSSDSTPRAPSTSEHGDASVPGTMPVGPRSGPGG